MPTETLIENYLAQNGVTKIPAGQSAYKPGVAPMSRKSRLLYERHERVRQMYRDLITYGFDKWEIAEMMQVREQHVRDTANDIGMIQKLRGYGQCRTV